MADEIRSYAPTERRLARLRALGFIPTSRALVGAVVIAVAWLGLLAAGPALVDCSARALRGSLELAAGAEEASAAQQALSWLGLRGGAIAALAGIICLTAAVTVTQMQAAGWGRSSGVPTGGSLPGSRAASPRAGPGLGEAGWLVMIAAVAVLTTVLAGRSALAYAQELMCGGPGQVLETSARAVVNIGWRVVAALLGVGVLDYLMQRAAFLRVARMSRREMQDELRQTEGHPLTAERRAGRRSRRPRDG